MSWELVLILFYLIFTSGQIVQKVIVDTLPRAKSLSLQFFIATGIMVGYVSISGSFQFEQSLILISGVGLINAWGAYCQWRAYGYSLSKTVLFFPLTGMITVSLAAIFLGEEAIYTPQIILGSILLFSAAFFLAKEGAEEKKDFNFRWLFFVLGMVLIQGFTIFMAKHFSGSVARSTFLLYWYAGSFLGSLIVLLTERSDKRSFFQRAGWKIPLASLAMVGSMATVYWAFQLAPVAIIEPLRRFGMVLFPMLAGWFILKERRKLSKVQILGILLGISGALLIILGTR